MKKKRFTKRFCAFALSAAMLLTPCVYAKDAATAGKGYTGYRPNYKATYDSYQYRMFNDLLDLYVETHLYEFTKEEAMEAFIMKLLKEEPGYFAMYLDSLLGTMDEYSAYYEAGMGLASDGSTGGYGVTAGTEESYRIRDLGLTEKGVYITDICPDSEAQKAGLAVGDRIVAVDGSDVTGLTFDSVMDMVRYLPYVKDPVFNEASVADPTLPAYIIPDEPEYIKDEEGNKKYILRLTVQRGTERIEVKLTKGRFTPSLVALDIPEGKDYGYIAISGFTGDNVAKDFAEALDELRKRKIENVIIDVRDNGGGRLDMAIEMGNMLIAEKDRILFYVNDRTLETPEPEYSTGGGEGFGKIAVLVNENSASAAELFANILKFNANAVLIGTKTFGKAVGQYSYEIPGGDLITITSFEILDPLKNSYNREGITPDLEIANALKQYIFPTEPLEVFNYINYKELCEGSQGDTVTGLEKRLVMLGFMNEEHADGVYDKTTTSAIRAMQTYYHNDPTGALCDKDVEIITMAINRLKHEFYHVDSPYDVAEMYFRSLSQAKRRVKEIERENKEATDARKAYEDAVYEQIMKEEAEERRKEAEAEAAAKAEQENTEQTDSETAE